MKRILITAILLLVVSCPMFASDVPKHLQDISVTIVVSTEQGTAQGSGVLFTRKDKKGDSVNFVWTAGHVVAHARTTREIVDSKGARKIIIEFTDVQIVQNIVEDGRTIGRYMLDAEVLKYSDADDGEDLAVLRIRKKNFVKEGAQFYLDKEMPKVGTELYHVGSLLGLAGANSLTAGIVSQVGRVHEKKLYDQYDGVAFPGSSGGGMFLKENSKYVGMLVRGYQSGFTFFVPVRRMVQWVDANQIRWTMDPSVPMPTDEEIANIPVEGLPSLLSAGTAVSSKKAYALPFMINWYPAPQVLVK